MIAVACGTGRAGPAGRPGERPAGTGGAPGLGAAWVAPLEFAAAAAGAAAGARPDGPGAEPGPSGAAAGLSEAEAGASRAVSVAVAVPEPASSAAVSEAGAPSVVAAP